MHHYCYNKISWQLGREKSWMDVKEWTSKSIPKLLTMSPTSLWQQRLEEDLCWIIPHMPKWPNQSKVSMDWTELKATLILDDFHHGKFFSCLTTLRKDKNEGYLTASLVWLRCRSRSISFCLSARMSSATPSTTARCSSSLWEFTGPTLASLMLKKKKWKKKP